MYIDLTSKPRAIAWTLLIFLTYAILTGVILSKLWFEYVFYRDHYQQTRATEYLAYFYLVAFSIGCIITAYTTFQLVRGLSTFVMRRFPAQGGTPAPRYINL